MAVRQRLLEGASARFLWGLRTQARIMYQWLDLFQAKGKPRLEMRLGERAWNPWKYLDATRQRTPTQEELDAIDLRKTSAQMQTNDERLSVDRELSPAFTIELDPLEGPSQPYHPYGDPVAISAAIAQLPTDDVPSQPASPLPYYGLPPNIHPQILSQIIPQLQMQLQQEPVAPPGGPGPSSPGGLELLMAAATRAPPSKSSHTASTHYHQPKTPSKVSNEGPLPVPRTPLPQGPWNTMDEFKNAMRDWAASNEPPFKVRGARTRARSDARSSSSCEVRVRALRTARTRAATASWHARSTTSLAARCAWKH